MKTMKTIAVAVMLSGCAFVPVQMQTLKNADGVGMSFTGIGWWSVLMPLVSAPLVRYYLPMKLWRREPGTPRWAHPSATLDAADVELANEVVASLKPVQRNAGSEWCPATTGDKFSSILFHADQFNCGHT